MNEAAVAPVAAGFSRPASARTRRNWLNPLEAFERGFVLFKWTFAQDAWRYYAGAAPLVLCFIPIWVIDGQIRISSGGLVSEAMLLAGAYLLRLWLVGSYVEHVRQRAFGVPIPKAAGASSQAAAMGRLLTWKIILSGAALAALPTFAGASWFYSACQFASLEAREDVAERHSLRSCLALSGQWFGGGLLLYLMLFPMWIAVWLNGFLLAILVPQLLHSIFGVGTLLSTGMGMQALSQSSAFWLSLLAGTWLALDPIVKCTFVVVYQHLRSRREGDDLRGLLASLPREQKRKAEVVALTGTGSSVKVGVLVALAAILFGACQATEARAARAPQVGSVTETPADAARQERVQKLRQALDEESQRAIYRWHDADHPSPPTWLDRLEIRIERDMRRAWDAFWKFIYKWWPRGLHLSLGNEKGVGRLKDLRLWLAMIAALTIAAGAVLIWRRRRRSSVYLSIPIATAPLPDLSDTAVASELSEQEWFALADRLQGEGELRLALRAVYLGLLAGLAQREWLTIRRDRTNREYLDEFTRRWRRRPQAAVEMRAEIPEKLRGSLRDFDRVWYGSYSLTPAAVAAYRDDQRELLDHVR